MKKNYQTAFTLLEMVIVLAIIAILAAVLLPPMIKRLDLIASEKESATLKSMAQAFKESVQTWKHVPSETGWAQAVALQLGVEVGDVNTNERRQPRRFLIDPALRIGNNNSPSLPYTQPVAGAQVTNGVAPPGDRVVRPIRPRFMIVTSTSRALPGGVVSGISPSSGAFAFTNIWETPEGVVPAGWSWDGAQDLKIQRIDLSDLFVQAILSNKDTNLTAYYAIDDIGTNSVSPFTNPPDSYYIRTTELRLLNNPQAVEYSEILQESANYIFELGSWQAKPYLGRGVGQPGALDLQRAMNLFLAAPTNAAAQNGVVQVQVHDAMISYMSNFVTWRNAGYPGQFQGQGNPPAYVDNAQTALANLTSDIIDPN